MAKEENPNRSKCLTALSGAFVVIVLFAFFGTGNNAVAAGLITEAWLDEASARLDEASAGLDEARARVRGASARVDEAVARFKANPSDETKARAKEALARLDEAKAKLEEAIAWVKEAKAGLDPCQSTGYFEKGFVGGWIYSDGDHHMSVRRAFPDDYNDVTRALELTGAGDRVSVREMLSVLGQCP